MKGVQEVLSELKQSTFRSRIHLQQKELEYLHKSGMSEVVEVISTWLSQEQDAAEKRKTGNTGHTP